MKANCAILLMLFFLMSTSVTLATSSCQTQCGNINISYPFGIGPSTDCFRPGFDLTCIHEQLFLGNNTDIPVTNISLDDGQVFINTSISNLHCSQHNIAQDYTNKSSITLSKDGPFSFSGARNTFVTIGCDIVTRVSSVVATANGTVNSTSDNFCASVCLKGPNSAQDDLCSGIGCCKTDIVAGSIALQVVIVSIQKEITEPENTRPCTVGFLADTNWFRFRREQLSDNSFDSIGSKIPVVLDWAILLEDNWTLSCKDASKNSASFACRSKNSFCYDVQGRGGYRCGCASGFEGNPYVRHGCTDVDECKEHKDNCNKGDCLNTIGSFVCSCPQGQYLTIQNYTCILADIEQQSTVHLATKIIVAICSGGVGVLILCSSSILLYIRLKQRHIKKHREMCFRQNHGLLLQKLLSYSEDNIERTKIFSLEELEKATNNFDSTRILGRGGHGAVYKGILSDQRVVAIKKADIVVQSEIEQFINEVAILSQINHRNVVKLFGCCLETEVPLLVYEFISGGTLSQHLHVVGNHVTSLSFDDRLRIAIEVAGALAYLHSAASISIFHRDIKSTNILLDHNFTAKLSDFGASRSIPNDKTHITTMVQGTFGYLDPEYYHTGQLTDKSDVYSFGVIIVELLTGERAISHMLLKQEKSLAMQFIWALKENCLFQILDARITEEGRKEQLEEMAKLAEMCLRLKGEERPTMKRVEQILNELSKTTKQRLQNSNEQNYLHEIERHITNAFSGSNSNSATSSYRSEEGFRSFINHPRRCSKE